MIVQPSSTINMTIGPSADSGGPVVMSDGEPAIESVIGSPSRAPWASLGQYTSTAASPAAWASRVRLTA